MKLTDDSEYCKLYLIQPYVVEVPKNTFFFFATQLTIIFSAYSKIFIAFLDKQ